LATENLGRAVSVEEIEEILQPLVERGLMIKEEVSYLSLAVPVGEYSPEKAAIKQLVSLITKREHRVSQLNVWCELID
jgi:hypothetical protein